ncbi:phosphate ABC transporter membrane protein 1, PhoT family [Desulfocapsa sulfexigens DSM 10523]|uniref:Phosphate transport system permease protein n=1 Tax=Desulfocapsa sulfexigens (strain DSM 10523 / SB164P1) TaxID=1167006 RepID=M1P1V2_DESSD|nr:phosphate ABC transporter permease subunit PstC [Desulfocapsa sulfexigens]AGF77463.1 phosphate ABC transporter membrane protein 1, PhoT family [Desulfocapsa sulfexigens DSM 10523]
MSSSFFLIILMAIASFAYMQGKRRAFSLSGGRLCGSRSLHSRPGYYGMLTAVWCVLPALLVFGVWMVLSDTILTALALKTLPASMHNLSADQSNLLVNDLRNLVAGHVAARDIDPLLQQAAVQYQGMERIGRVALGVVMFSVALLSASLVYMRIRPEMRARNHVERIIQLGLVLCSTIAILTTLGIVLSVLFESIRFFQQVPVTDFLFGMKWSPQMAMRADQAGSSGSFGAVPVLAGTFMISGIALTVAVPIGLMSAIYLSEYANSRVRAWAKPIMEILAGVPTVVYGFFAALVVAPFVRNSGEMLGLNVSSESALAAGLVMGIMIIPFVSSLSDDVINAVPQAMRDGSYGLGATKSETIMNVIIPAALPGIVGGVLLAASRAIGETMIVVMAAGLSANLTANPLQAVTTVTVQIVTLLVGDQEFDSPKTLVAFALGLLLFIVTLILNVIALYVVRKYREEYE